MIHNKNSGIFNVPRNDSERKSVSFLFRETGFWEDNKEDVNRCSSTLDIYFMRQTLAVIYDIYFIVGPLSSSWNILPGET